MKLFFVNRYFYPDLSATSQLLSDLAFYLADHDYEVHVITSRLTYSNLSTQLPSEEVVNSVHVHRVWSFDFGHSAIGRIFDYLSFYISSFRYLSDCLQPTDLVVAKTDPPLISVVAYLIASRRKAMLINWLQDLFPEVAVRAGVLSDAGILEGCCRNWRDRSLQYAGCNVAISQLMADRVRTAVGPETRVATIPNWADNDLIQPVNPTENSLRKQWHLTDSFVVGYSGNMGRAHEFETVLDCAEMMASESSIVFLFIGDGIRKSWLEQQVVTRKLNNVIFKNYQPRERLAESLSVPDVHIVTLRPVMEGVCTPSKLYGAMAAGRPVIFVGDPGGEAPEILVGHNCGFAVEAGASATLAEHVRELERNSDQRRLMGIRARQAVEQQFSKSRGLNSWRSVISSVISVATSVTDRGGKVQDSGVQRFNKSGS